MDINSLVRKLTASLFVAEERRLNGKIVELNTRNKQVRKLQVDGFLFSGQFYLPTGVSTVRFGPGQAKAPLHDSLVDSMEEYLADQKSIRTDQNLIRQTLFQVLSNCRTDQDFRNALPECLVEHIEGLNRLSRTEEPGYTVRSNPRALRQFQKALPKIELYAATRLIY